MMVGIPLKTNAAWTGHVTNATQTPDGIKVTVHVDVAANQGQVDKDRVYFMSPKGDKMMMKSPGIISPTSGAAESVEIDLVKAD
jgi:hypothetical protein